MFVATVLILISMKLFVDSRPTHDGHDYHLCLVPKNTVNENDLVLDDIEDQLRNSQKPSPVVRQTKVQLLNWDFDDEEADVVPDPDVWDRQDHVTQYVMELFINTDDENMDLEAMDAEQDTPILNFREDSFPGVYMDHGLGLHFGLSLANLL